MDRSQLVTIAVTAAISVTAKELLTWMFSLVKILSVRDKTKARLRKVFNKANLSIAFDIFWIVFLIILLISNLKDTSPLTRKAVFTIVLLVIGFLAALLSLTFDLVRLLVDRHFAKIRKSVEE